MVVATLAAAFSNDPAWGFILGDEYERLVGHFAGALFELRVRSQSVWVIDDFAAVALWDAPGARDGRSRDAKAVWAHYRAVAGDEAYERVTRYNDAVATVSPTEPFWYLGALATRPERQRQGLATALLTPVLRQADEQRTACCLETSTHSNRGFYRNRGFTESTTVALEGGPPIWWLRRAPRPVSRA